MPNRHTTTARFLDPRFTGDPWIDDLPEGLPAVCLGNYQVTGLSVLPLDLPSFNRVLQRLRTKR